MAGRLAARGHDVLVYAPIPTESGVIAPDPRGAAWGDCTIADFTREGIWILNRCPDVLDNFPEEHPNQKLWLLSEDVSYATMTEERAKKLDRYICLCQSHAMHIEQTMPFLKEKICIGANGVKMDLIREIEKNPPARNPHKMIFASSPDRGLLMMLRLFRRIKEWIGDAELHCFYGFGNIDRIIENYPHHSKQQQKLKESVMREMDQPGVVWHDRVGQPELYREFFSAGLWVHPESRFTETFCDTQAIAQSCGAIPVTFPIWAIGEYVQHGAFVQGDAYTDELTRARFVGEVFKIASNPGLQDKIRREMMSYGRVRFNWERSIDLLESWMLGFEGLNATTQFTFQHKHMEGKVLNIGCSDDPSHLKSRGDVVNLDVNQVGLFFGQPKPNEADIIADCRDLPGVVRYRGYQFDCAILGDILEHFPVEEVPSIITKAVHSIKPGGKIIITVPDDHRPVRDQNDWAKGDEQYAPGVHAFHTHPVPKEEVEYWADVCGLKVEVLQEIDYTWFKGHGLVARTRQASLLSSILKNNKADRMEEANADTADPHLRNS